jgi:AcrR family transcriptional regulator
MGIVERKGREKEARREEIVQAAIRVFNAKGLQDATMEEIAETAELSKATIYLYYKSKEDLYLEYMLHGMKKLHRMMRETIEKKTSFIAKVDAMGTVYTDFFEKDIKLFRSMNFYSHAFFHSQVSPEIKEMCQLENESIWDFMNGVFKKGVEEGLMKPDIKPEEATVMLWSNANAILVRIDNENQYWSMRGIDLQRVLNLSGFMLFTGMLTERGIEQLRIYRAQKAEMLQDKAANVRRKA